MMLSLPKLRADQAAIARHPARVKVLAMGRRWGKSILCTTLGLGYAARGAKVAWVVPTYKNGRPLWRQATMRLARLGDAVSINKTERIVEFAPSRGRLSVYSADNPDAVRGEAFDLVVLDEAAFVGEDIWVDVVMPTLADRKGRAYLISTPKGRNWFHREWMLGKQDGEYQASWHAPTSANPSPAIQEAYLRARQKVPARKFSQEWDAEFISFEGQVFASVRQLAHAILQDSGTPGRQYVAGLDWGKLQDRTVLTILDTGTNHVVHTEVMEGIEYQKQLARIQGVCSRFPGLRAIVAETNAMGEPLFESAARRGLPVQRFQTTNATKAQIIDDLVLAFEQRAIAIPNDDALFDELENFAGKKLPSGVMSYGAQDGFHDDRVMSLALAWSATQVTVPAGEQGDEVQASHYHADRRRIRGR